MQGGVLTSDKACLFFLCWAGLAPLAVTDPIQWQPLILFSCEPQPVWVWGEGFLTLQLSLSHNMLQPSQGDSFPPAAASSVSMISLYHFVQCWEFWQGGWKRSPPPQGSLNQPPEIPASKLGEALPELAFSIPSARVPSTEKSRTKNLCCHCWLLLRKKEAPARWSP